MKRINSYIDFNNIEKIVVGDFVRCIDDTFMKKLKKGKIYQIVDIFKTFKSVITYRIKDDDKIHSSAYNADRFEKISDLELSQLKYNL